MYVPKGLIFNGDIFAFNKAVKELRIKMIQEAKMIMASDTATIAHNLYIGMSLGLCLEAYDPKILRHNFLATKFKRAPIDPKWDTKPLSSQQIIEIACNVVDTRRVKTQIEKYIVSLQTSENYDVKIEVIPIKDKLLVIPKVNDIRLYKILVNSGYFDDYHFDPKFKPANISNEKWAERKRDWDEVESLMIPSDINPCSLGEYGFPIKIIDGEDDLPSAISVLVDHLDLFVTFDDEETIQKCLGFISESNYNKTHKIPLEKKIKTLDTQEFFPIR